MRAWIGLGILLLASCAAKLPRNVPLLGRTVEATAAHGQAAR